MNKFRIETFSKELREGVDIKMTDSRPYVIEVNDNPCLDGGEDTHYPELYAKIVSFLFNKKEGERL